ncbi:hypothetical protein [Ideonella sp.]|uniref:hypothetical protein n=1 Tax=Ideonella sp. TaxID=1929293 RepID=UPI002B49F9F0|nr:hypothetical protein [Ideonella sp.]HJV69633.1 hypothetical protein [Ideonella sp.]
MNIEEALREQWLPLRERLQARHLLGADDDSLSLRIPGTGAMWFGTAGDAAPRRTAQSAPVPQQASVHAAVYAARADVGAIAIGGGEYGHCLPDFGGALPQVFDEQARHLGPMGPPTPDEAGIADALAGGGNVLLVQGRVVCLGLTATRLALNAELFEKCAKAYVLAVASGGRVRPLPGLVRFIANRRLHKDERRARQRFAQGLLPEEAKGY